MTDGKMSLLNKEDQCYMCPSDGNSCPRDSRGCATERMLTQGSSSRRRKRKCSKGATHQLLKRWSSSASCRLHVSRRWLSSRPTLQHPLLLSLSPPLGPHPRHPSIWSAAAGALVVVVVSGSRADAASSSVLRLRGRHATRPDGRRRPASRGLR